MSNSQQNLQALLGDIAESNLLCFGVRDIEAWFKTNISPFDCSDRGSIRLFVLSIASDVQELISRNRIEEARQLLNRQKWVISQKLRQ